MAGHEWEPAESQPADEATVRLKIDARELALRQAVKQAGGLWKPGERVWEVRYDQAIALGLEDRVVG